GSALGTTFTEDSFDAGRTAGSGKPMTSRENEPKVRTSGLNHTSHDGSRSTDAGRTAKMNDRSKADEPKQHSATTTATGFRSGHPNQPKKTGKMAAHTDAHRPASY